ncbi:MAG: hypothetical protein M3Y75_02835 [Actinomycetota bacterium]|nr:hypothetical protein [Actinomycetota bacterium]
MEAVRDKWTDERLDDMNGRMGEGFDRLDKDIREVRSEIAGVRSEIAQVRIDLLEEMNRRFEATHRLIVQVGGGLFGTMAIGFLSLVLTQG